MQKYQGSCHCGRVSFELEARIAVATECNCSICRKKGAVWHATDDAHLRIVSGQANLGLYQFGTMTAKHYFCTSCGIGIFSRPRIAPDRWVVNLRCVDDIDLSELKVHPFDGEHWEEAAEQLMQARASRAA